jgi:hypothetical protein
MTEPKSPVERAVEVLVFAPVGLAVTARELLPRLVERGRQQVTGQLTTAKVIGQFAVQQGQSRAERAFERAQASARSTLEQRGQGDGAVRRAPHPAAPSGEKLATASTSTPTPVTPTASAPAASTAPGPDGSGAPSPAPAVPRPEPVAVRPDPSPTTAMPAATAPGRDSGPLSAALPIPAYDSLSASQVVPRLSSLTAEELESVRAYETAHRGRKTILNKVAQLASS